MPSQPSKGVSIIERVTEWADSPPAGRLFFTLWIHTIVRIIYITVRETQINRLSIRSSALTYTLLLSMVPMLAMTTALVKGLGGGDQLRDIVYHYIDTLEESSSKPFLDFGSTPAPDEQSTDSESKKQKEEASITKHLRSAANQLFDYVDQTNFATLGTFGMLGIFLTVILVLNHIEAAMNAIWHVEAGRSILRKITDYITLMVLLPLSINVAIASGTILGSQALTVHFEHYIPAGWITLLVLQGVPIFALSITLYVLYMFFPNTKPGATATLIGAVFAGTFWFITQNLYISLQVGVAKYNAIYGSFATFPLFLIWIYFGWLFILLGAQLAFAIQYRTQYQIIKCNDAPAIKLSAALDIASLVSERFIEQRGTTPEDIRETFPIYSTEVIRAAQDTLITSGLIHHARESGELMPSMAPEYITHSQIITAVLGTKTPDSNGGKTSATAIITAASAFTDTPEGKEESARKST